jgi:hypothetical protein
MGNGGLDVWRSIFAEEKMPEFLFFKNVAYNIFVMFATEGTALVIEIVIGIITILTFAAGSIRWLTKHYFDEIRAELKPNSGSSLKDQVTRLEEKQKDAELDRKEIHRKLDRMYDILLEHVSNHNK